MKNNLETLKSILGEKFGIAQEQVLPTASLTGDLNLSQIEIIDFLDLLTSRLNITMPEDIDVESLNTIADILNLIEQQSLEI